MDTWRCYYCNQIRPNNEHQCGLCLGAKPEYIIDASEPRWFGGIVAAWTGEVRKLPEIDRDAWVYTCK